MCVCVCQSEFNGIFFLSWISWLKKMNINENKRMKKKIALHTYYYADVNASHCKLPFSYAFFWEILFESFYFFRLKCLKSSEICSAFTWLIYFQSEKWMVFFIYFYFNVVLLHECRRLWSHVLHNNKPHTYEFFLRAQWELKECLQHTQVAVNSKTGPIWWSPPPSTASIYIALRCTFFLFQFILLCSFV